MTTQGHSSLPDNVTPYEVSFGRKYRDRINSLTTVEEVPRPIKFTDEWINDAVDKNLPIIDEVMKKYVVHEAYEEDGEEDGKQDEEKMGRRIGKKNLEDREENREEDREENREVDEEDDGEEDEVEKEAAEAPWLRAGSTCPGGRDNLS